MLQKVQLEPDFLDLTDSRFHQNGFVPPPEIFQKAFSDYLATRAYQPDSRGFLPAREAVSDFYAHQGLAALPSHIFFTAGTSEAYTLLFSSLAQAGDKVLLPRPGYPLFEQLVAQSRLKAVFYDQTFSREWQLDPSCLKGEEGLRFLVLISPNNPTGQILNEKSLQIAAQFCLENDLILICDEVFDLFLYEQKSLPRPAALFPQVKTVTLNGISKRFASPDLKLAWSLFTGPQDWCRQTTEHLDLINDAYLSANSFSQMLLPRLFAELTLFQKNLVSSLSENRQRLCSWIKDQPHVQSQIPQGGIHGLMRIEGLKHHWDDEKFCLQLLKEEHLALHPGYYYDVQEAGLWVVYSLLKKPEDFSAALDRLSSFLSRNAAR